MDSGAASEQAAWWDEFVTMRSDTMSAPRRHHGWDYFTIKRDDKRVLARVRPDGGLPDVRTVVDPSAFGADQEIESWAFGPGPGQVMVWTVGPTEIGTLRVVDADTGRVVGDPVADCLQGSAAGQSATRDRGGRVADGTLLYYTGYDDPEDVGTGFLKLRTDPGLAAGADVRIPLPPNPQEFTFTTAVDLTSDGEHHWLTAVRWHGNALDVQILAADLNAPGARPDRPDFTVTETTMPGGIGHGLNIRDGHATFATTDDGRHPNGAVFRVPVAQLHRRDQWGEPLIAAAADPLKHLKAVEVVGRGEHTAIVAQYNHDGVMAAEVFTPDGRGLGAISRPGPAIGGTPSVADLQTYEGDDGRPGVQIRYDDINGSTSWRHTLGRDAPPAVETRLSQDHAEGRPAPIAVEEEIVPFRFGDGREGRSILVRKAGAALPATASYATAYAYYHWPELRYGPASSPLWAGVLESGGSIHHIVSGPILGGHGLADAPRALIAAQKNTNALGLTRPETAFVYGISAGASAAAVAVQHAPDTFGGGAILGNGSVDWSRETLARSRYGVCQENAYAFGDPDIAAAYGPTNQLREHGLRPGPVPRYFVYGGRNDIRTPWDSQSGPYVELLRSHGVDPVVIVDDSGHMSDSGRAGLTARVMAATQASLDTPREVGPAPRGTSVGTAVDKSLRKALAAGARGLGVTTVPNTATALDTPTQPAAGAYEVFGEQDVFVEKSLGKGAGKG